MNYALVRAELGELREMSYKRVGCITALLLLMNGHQGYAEQWSSSSVMTVKINMQQCIKQNNHDCLKAICLASPDSCNAQCAANAREKCKLLAGQTL